MQAEIRSVKLSGRVNLNNGGDIVKYARAHLGKLTREQLDYLQENILQTNDFASIKTFHFENSVQSAPLIKKLKEVCGQYGTFLESLSIDKFEFTYEERQDLVEYYVVHNNGCHATMRKLLEPYFGMFDLDRLNEAVKTHVLVAIKGDDERAREHAQNLTRRWATMQDLIDVGWVADLVVAELSREPKTGERMESNEFEYNLYSAKKFGPGAPFEKCFNALLQNAHKYPHALKYLMEWEDGASNGALTAEHSVRILKLAYETREEKDRRKIYERAKLYPDFFKSLVEDALKSDLIITVAYFARNASAEDKPKFVSRLRELVARGELTVQMLSGDFSWGDVISERDIFGMGGMHPMMFMRDGFPFRIG